MVREQVTSTPIGKMRMQFWRDSIKSIYNVRYIPSPMTQAISSHLHIGTTSSTPSCISITSSGANGRHTSLPLQENDRCPRKSLLVNRICDVPPTFLLIKGCRPRESDSYITRFSTGVLRIYFFNDPIQSPASHFSAIFLGVLSCRLSSRPLAHDCYLVARLTVSCIPRPCRYPSRNYSKTQGLSRGRDSERGSRARHH